jgi:hypothetical protein
MFLVIKDAIFAAIADSKVIVHGFRIEEIFFNHVAAIAQAHNKVLEAVAGRDFPYVPNDRTPTDIN